MSSIVIAYPLRVGGSLHDISIGRCYRHNSHGALHDIQPSTRSNILGVKQGRTHRCGPGEQRRRGYKWDVDIERHTFGRPGSLAMPLRLDCGSESHSRLVSKKLDDFRETQDVVGRVKNLGHDSRDHLGKVT